MGSVDNNLYEFGEFVLDAEESVLRHGEELIILPPKVFETLFLLIRKQGSIVTKSEMLNTIWSDSFVEESNLTQNIYTLRKILGKNESGKQLIETVARRGYRIAVPVKILTVDEIPSFSGKQIKQSFPAASDNLFNEQSDDFLAKSPTQSIDFLTEVNGVNYLPEQTSVRTISGPTERKVSFSKRRTIVFFGLGILILLTISFSIYKLVNSDGEKNDSKISLIEQLRFRRLTDSGDVVFPTISPNGEMLAYVRLEAEGGSVWIKQIATDSSVQILPPSRKGYRSLAFSPDGKYLFFCQEAEASGIFQTSILGGTPKKVADNVWSDFSISPDGKQFAFLRRDTGRKAHLLILANMDGNVERELSIRQSPLDYRGSIGWSPDGTKIITVGGVQEEIFPKLLTIDVSNGEENEIKTPRWRAISRAIWTPDGRNLIVSARETNESNSQIWALSYPEGEVRRLTNDLESYFWLSLTADGQKLVTRQQKITSHLWILPDGDIKKAKQITFGERNFDGYVGLAWAPDDKIIFSVRNDHITDLYKMNYDGTNRVQLTANAGLDNTYPIISRDGKYIIFTSNRTETTQIWRMDIDGRNPKQLSFGEKQNERALSATLTSDGTEVFFIKRGAAAPAIWKVSIDGENPVQVSNLINTAPEGFLSISPDGKWIAFRQISTNPEIGGDLPKIRIRVIPKEGTGEPRLFDLPMRRPIIQWSADSQSFDYSAGNFNTSSLVRQPLAGGESKKMFDFPDRVFNFVWSPDGKTLAVSRGRQQGDAILITNLP